MKKILALTLLAITVSVSVFAQQDFKFSEGSFNFGKIAQGTPVTHVLTLPTQVQSRRLLNIAQQNAVAPHQK